MLRMSLTNVPTWCESQSTNQASTEVTDDVTCKDIKKLIVSLKHELELLSKIKAKDSLGQLTPPPAALGPGTNVKILQCCAIVNQNIMILCSSLHLSVYTLYARSNMQSDAIQVYSQTKIENLRSGMSPKLATRDWMVKPSMPASICSDMVTLKQYMRRSCIVFEVFNQLIN